MDDDNNRPNLPSQEPAPPREPEKSSRFWNRAATVARIGRVSRYVYENTSVDKLIDTVRLGKDVYDAVKEENRAAQAEGRESRSIFEVAKSTGTGWLKEQLDDIATPIARDEDVAKTPYYWKAESKRLAELAATEKEAGNAFRKGVRQGDTDPQNNPTVYDLHRKLETLRQPSMAESLSRIGYAPRWQEEENRRFTDAARGAEQFRKQYFVGTAAEKYQYFLDTARKELGENALDRRTNPEAVLKLERLATEYLYTSGYNLSEITAAVRQKSPFITGVDEGKYINTVTERFNRSYPAAELDKARQDLSKWRAEHDLSPDDRCTPQELVEAFGQIQKDRMLASWQAFDRYQKNPALIPSTLGEFQIEAARRYQLNGWKPLTQAEEKDIAFRLKIAGHSSENIVEALDKANVSSVFDKNFGLQTTVEVGQEIKNNPSYQKIQQIVDDMKKNDPTLTNETRLDRLHLDTPLSGTQEKTIDRHVSVPNKEIER
ncbi:hypothetical protein [Nostoc sp. ChiQUE01b]|uniref:hypothetical protein n=1 Tax=Nostoc sp. ChiQUE01b TaxID=3075376 RepID=UPI002AD312E4|nr:hypothetical protein [Nostoc sp. ChiQUE01b]MDZ8260598.1 hypothetical protein [Nostoc sp. ChiQUE01b]